MSTSKVTKPLLKFFRSKDKEREKIELETSVPLNSGVVELSEEDESKVIIGDNLYFNTLTKRYVIYLKSVGGKNITLPESVVKSIYLSYSDLYKEASTIEDVMRLTKLPRECVKELLSIFQLNHSSLPITPYEFLNKNDEEIIQDLESQRKFTLQQKIEHRTWANIQNEASQWRDFKYNTLDPFERFTQNIKPISKPKIKLDKSNADHSLLIGLSDLHFGASSAARYLFSKTNKGWNLDDTNKAIDLYLVNILKLTKERSYKFKECVAFSCGDILHGLYSKTVKGTDIEAFPQGEEQFDSAFNCLARFFEGLSEILPLSRVVSLTGNHSLSDAHLFKCLKAYFRNYEGLIFNVYDSRWAVEVVGELGIVVEHGASPYYKHKLPPNGSQRESYIQKLIWEQREILKNCKQVAFISADQHHFEYNEKNNFEQIMFSTIVGKDKYSNQNGFFNKPRQNGLVIQDGKITEVLNFYFE